MSVCFAPSPGSRTREPFRGGRSSSTFRRWEPWGTLTLHAVAPCPSIEQGQGNVVTGTFHHEADPDTRILRIQFSDNTVLAGVTDNHPFWSEDRYRFVAAGDLRIGDRVRLSHGTASVALVIYRLARPGEMLCNLEIHNEHVYMVTTAGILVHNSCVDEEPNGPKGPKAPNGNTARPPRAQTPDQQAPTELAKEAQKISRTKPISQTDAQTLKDWGGRGRAS